MRDPYDVLGVSKTADEAEIKRAYRKLAKKLHPDANASDPKAQDRFAELNTAHEILSDKEKRGQFDRGEIDAEGKPRAPEFSGFGGGGPRRGPGGFSGFDGDTIFESFSFGPEGARRTSSRGGGGGFEDIGDIFGFGRQRRSAGGGFAPQPGADMEITLPVSFEEATQGASKRVGLPNGKQIDIKIAPGTREGHRMRLKGQGEPSPMGGPAGDAYVTISYATHPVFERDGDDLRQSLDVPLADAVLGAKVRVPTLTGAVELAIPAWTSGGRTFRLRGKGLPNATGGHGDLLARVNVVLPTEKNAELEELMRKLKGEAA
ncbi:MULTISPECIES: DnaJ C-terminal domain-containing protein [Xanthobacter]|uniref:DnaJ C-terminal domain-containing protein n=1 Tax=Xanthobacter TaxID=279 RepID=UPI001AE1D753|nr:J domain-containing protein [Xanthobacter flavus]MBP2148818.1 DnaJ-class molecular chaperone [Xanthobacter flavus]